LKKSNKIASGREQVSPFSSFQRTPLTEFLAASVSKKNRAAEKTRAGAVLVGRNSTIQREENLCTRQ
jgi:hypothetical protein